MSFSKIIVRGTVVEELPTYIQDAGLDPRTNFKFSVTPSKVKVSKVIAGDIKVNDTIVFLQHGDRSTDKENFVKSNEDVILILNKTSDGRYWSYSYEDGLWKISNDKVSSKSRNDNLQKMKNLDTSSFENLLSNGFKNRVKPER